MKEKLQNLGNVDLVIIDYLECIQSETACFEHKNETACFEHKNWFFDIGRELHDLSQERKIPVLFLCKLPRNIDYRTDQRPSMQDFRNWIGLEQLVDIEMFLYRNSYPKCNETSYYHFDSIIECNIAKNKYGETETIPLNCRFDFKVLQSNNEV